MEFGLSQNNNILIPLINSIVENKLENSSALIGMIYDTILRFNGYIIYYPEYKQYLLKHTDYNVGLQQTYLKVYQDQKLFTLMDYFEKMFIDPPSLLFILKFYRLVIKNCNIDPRRIGTAIHCETPMSEGGVVDSFATQAQSAMEGNSMNFNTQDHKLLGDLEKKLLLKIIQGGEKGLGSNLCFIFTLFIE